MFYSAYLQTSSTLGLVTVLVVSSAPFAECFCQTAYDYARYISQSTSHYAVSYYTSAVKPTVMVSYASGALHFLIVLLVHVVVASTSQSLRMRLERSKPNPKLKNSLKARTNVWPILEIDGSSAAYALNSYFVQQFGAVGYDVYVAIGRSDIEGYLTIDTIGGCTFLVNCGYSDFMTYKD